MDDARLGPLWRHLHSNPLTKCQQNDLIRVAEVPFVQGPVSPEQIDFAVVGKELCNAVRNWVVCIMYHC